MSTPLPKISIITITYNNGKDLRRTVDGLMNLYALAEEKGELNVLINVRDIELVIINGGSCTFTQDYLQSLKERCPFTLRVVSESDGGIADALNKGITLSTGEHILILHSGDILLDIDYLQRAYTYLEEHPETLFVHSSIYFDDPLAGELIFRPLLQSLGSGVPYYHQTMIVRRSTYENIKLLSGDYYDTSYTSTVDHEWICRLEKKMKIQAYGDASNIPIKMCGGGLHQSKELLSFYECARSLWKFKLITPGIIFSFIWRFMKLTQRKILLYLFGPAVIIFIKKMRHR